MQQRTPRSEHLTSDAAASSAAANSAAADCAAPSSASALPSTLPAQSTGIPPRKRAIDVIRSLPTMSVPATKSTISSAAPPPQLTFGSFPSAPTSSTQLNRPLKPTSAPRVRARDVLKRISSVRAPVLPEPIQSTAELRHTVRPPKRRRSHSLEVDIDLTKDNSGSDEEERPCRSMFLEPELIYNTNDLLATRQTVRGWNNSSDPSSWILSREEWHSEQVDLDRLLPGALDDYPSFVRNKCFDSSIVFFTLFTIGHLRRRHAFVAPVSYGAVRYRNV